MTENIKNDIQSRLDFCTDAVLSEVSKKYLEKGYPSMTSDEKDKIDELVNDLTQVYRNIIEKNIKTIEARTVCFTCGMSDDCFIVSTNAPLERIEQFARESNIADENGKSSFELFEDIKKDFTWDLLADSENGHVEQDDYNIDLQIDLRDFSTESKLQRRTRYKSL